MKGLCVVHEAPAADEHPIKKVIVVPVVTVPLVVQVNFGTEVVSPVRAEHVTPFTFTTPVSSVEVPPFPLRAKVVAEGEAVFNPVPGKVIIIFPPLGIGCGFEKDIVCIAVWLAIKTSVPF